MVSIADVPEVVYTNDQMVDRMFSYLNEGDIKEIVERSLESESSNKGGGLKKILSIKYSKTSTEEGEQELVRQLDPVGKFAILHGHLEEEDDITYLDNIDNSRRREIESGDFVQAKGQISTSPINELQGMLQQFQPYFDMFDMNPEFEEQGQQFSFNDIQSFLDELNSDEDIYQVGTTSEGSDADLVFSLNKGELGELSDYTEYHVLGRVEHIYEQGEEEWLMDIMDLMPGNDREARQQRRMFLKQLAEGASDLLDRKVNEEDFKIGYPDIRVRPVAIYLF